MNKIMEIILTNSIEESYLPTINVLINICNEAEFFNEFIFMLANTPHLNILVDNTVSSLYIKIRKDRVSLYTVRNEKATQILTILNN